MLSPSTIDTGYVLSPSPLENPFETDHFYQRILQWYLPADVFQRVAPQLRELGDEAISQEVHDWIADAERQEPYVKQYDAWGRRYPYDKLVTSNGWKQLGRWGTAKGVVALGYEPEFGQHRRIVQHAFNYIYSASSAVRSCPISMSSGAARLVSQHLPSLPADHPFHGVYKRLIARDDNWVSSQWMTERPGGSDVQNSETVAIYSPLPHKTGKTGTIEEGDWLVSGFKWFSSATDCDMALILAKTESGQLSLFLAPTKKTVAGADGNPRLVTNGVRIHRMKKKMGTKELPTAELELTNVRAWMIGPVDRGIATIALLLNVTRTHNMFVALSCWRRALSIAKSFAKARSTINQPLWTFPMHLRLLAALEIKHQASLQLGFFTTALLSFADNGHPSPQLPDYPPLPEPGHQTQVVLRTFTATAKAIICKVGTLALQECQEAMGGVGYLDDPDDPEFNISRLYRDTAANMTWEGTTNVLGSEVIRHLLNKDHLEVFGAWLQRAIDALRDPTMRQSLASAWSALLGLLKGHAGDVGAALASARQYMFSLGWIVSGVLLAQDAQRDGNGVAVEMARRWVQDGDVGYGEWVLADVKHAAAAASSSNKSKGAKGFRKQTNWDCRIVWGCDLPEGAALGYRPTTAKAKL